MSLAEIAIDETLTRKLNLAKKKYKKKGKRSNSAGSPVQESSAHSEYPIKCARMRNGPLGNQS